MSQKLQWRRTLTAYAFMAPALILFLLFVFLPIAGSLPLSLFDYSVIGETKFIGFANFARAFQDKNFWLSIENSLLFVLVVPPIQLFSIILAVLVNQKLAGIGFFRFLYYIPVVTSMVAVSIIWGFLFNPDGIVNSTLLGMGVIKHSVGFLTDQRIALTSLMFITIWQGLGYYMMLYLSGLQSFPVDIEEAARVDGANAWTVLFRIKIPLLKPYVWFCTLNSVISAVNVFDVVFVLTQGGPNGSTLVTNYYSYYQAFNNFEFGYSAAVGLLLSVVTTAVSMIVFAYGKQGGGMTYND